MDFETGRWMLIIHVLLLTGFAQASPPYLAESPNNDYMLVPEDFNGTVFQIHVKDDDLGDKITADAADDQTRIYFNISVVPTTSTDVWVTVSVKNELDRETLGNVVQVQLRITDSQQNQLSYVFTVYIYDINDNDPVFQNVPYVLEIPEAPCNVNSVVFTKIVATDADSGENGQLTYSMVPKEQSQDASSPFTIDSLNGHVTLNACLDYEKVCYYQYIVTAKDSGPNGGRSATTELIVLVKDVPE